MASRPRPRFDQGNAYQPRREVNFDRLDRVAVLFRQSHRVAEIYRDLGIHPKTIKTAQSTVRHIRWIRPTMMAIEQGPITFGNVNGCASALKGVRIALSSLLRRKELGLNEKFRLITMSGVFEGLRHNFLDFSNVAHRGSHNRDNLDQVLGPIQVEIHLSIGEEVYGYVGIEFLAKGIPVIGNKIGGIVEYVVPGQTGWLNTENSGEGLANVMASLIRSPEQIISINRNIFANHDRIIKKMDTNVAEIDEIYRRVLARKGPSTTK